MGANYSSYLAKVSACVQAPGLRLHPRPPGSAPS